MQSRQFSVTSLAPLIWFFSSTSPESALEWVLVTRLILAICPVPVPQIQVLVRNKASVTNQIIYLITCKYWSGSKYRYYFWYLPRLLELYWVLLYWVFGIWQYVIGPTWMFWLGLISWMGKYLLFLREFIARKAGRITCKPPIFGKYLYLTRQVTGHYLYKSNGIKWVTGIAKNPDFCTVSSHNQNP